jgi:hypothetical protein
MGQGLQFRGDVFNLFNRQYFAQPASTIGSGFGQIASTQTGYDHDPALFNLHWNIRSE